jgi:hypothetical protein
MDQFRSAAGGSPGKVFLLHQKRLQPHVAGFAQYPGAGYPATDYHQIPLPAYIVYICIQIHAI